MLLERETPRKEKALRSREDADLLQDGHIIYDSLFIVIDASGCG
jgi:hypothetical protein